MTKKYRLLIRIWIPQDKLYDTVAEAYEVGKKNSQRRHNR